MKGSLIEIDELPQNEQHSTEYAPDHLYHLKFIFVSVFKRKLWVFAFKRLHGKISRLVKTHISPENTNIHTYTHIYTV